MVTPKSLTFRFSDSDLPVGLAVHYEVGKPVVRKSDPFEMGLQVSRGVCAEKQEKGPVRQDPEVFGASSP